MDHIQNSTIIYVKFLGCDNGTVIIWETVPALR